MPAKFEDAFRSHVAAQNFAVGTRWYFWEAPERATTPYAVYMPVGQEAIINHDGQVDLIHRAWSISVFAVAQRDAEDISRTIRQYLSGFVGKMEDVDVRQFLLNGETAGRDETTKYFAYTHTYSVRYHETASPFTA